MISPALGLGRLGQPALVDQEGGLLLGPRDDPLGLLLGLLDDPLALGVDPLGGADLFGDGDAQLVDEAERGVLVDHDVGRERQLLAVGDQRFEALDEKDDVDRSVLQAAPAGSLRMVGKYRTRDVGQRPARAARRRVARGARDHRRDVAAEGRDLLDQARADIAVLDRGHEEDRVDVRRQDAVVVGELHLGLEVADRAQAADDRAGAAGAAEVDGQAVERLDLDPVRRCAGLGERLADDADARLDVEQRRLARVGQDADDDAVEHGRGALDDVEVAVRDRVERARVDRDGVHRSSARR